MSNTHTVLKPIGSKSLKNFTEIELKEIKNAMCSGVCMEKYIDYKNAYIIDYQALTRLDNLFLYKFKEGEDLSYILSIPDWTDHTFRGIGSLIEKLFKDFTSYSAKYEKEFYNQNNAELIWENFNQYINSFNGSDGKWSDQKKHEYLSKFCKSTLRSYAYHLNINPNKAKENRSFNLYVKNIKALKEYYIKKPVDSEYFARVCLNILHELIIYSRGNISLDDRIVKGLVLHIEPEINKLWNSIGFIIKDNLFKNIQIKSESFNISEYLISLINKDDFKKILLNDFLCNPVETKHIDKQIYFLAPLWEQLSNQEFSLVLMGCFKTLTLESIISFIKEINVPEKVLEIVKSTRLFPSNIKKEDYEKIVEVLNISIFEKKLHSSLIEKETQSIKISKI